MFHENFLWGAATASYQIEGAFTEGGRGESIWDTFSHEPGKVKNSDTGDIACDHYHRFRDDIKLMQEMGLQAYRFSIAWPRILPDGTGKVNPEGVAFYRSLLTVLREAGIVPYVTLYHWDLPRILYEKGGWASPESPAWFREYTEAVVENLGDLIDNYITFNEPSVFIKGVINGEHAPGLKADTAYIMKFWHHILCAHGEAVRVIRSRRPDAKIGVAPATTPYIPVEEKDTEACRREYFAANRHISGSSYQIRKDFCNCPSMFLDPIFFGKYPEDCLSYLERYLPEGWKSDLEKITGKLDFLALNVYQGRKCYEKDGVLTMAPQKVGFPRTAIDWRIEPKCLYYALKFHYERYHIPMVISENGISCHDWVSLDGKVHDPNRIDYLNRHLLLMEKAIDDGVEMLAYFQWSLMDNFEWARGYYDRFGLVYVDYETQERILKDSAYWYREVIRTNGRHLHRFDSVGKSADF